MKIRSCMLVTIGVAALAGAFFVGDGTSASGMKGAGANALLGSWKVHLTPIDPPQPEFEEMMTFTSGGGIVESNTFPFFLQNLTAGPGQGTWQYSGNQTFPFTFAKFLYAPNGAAVGTLKVQGTITYSNASDTWSGPAVVSVCDVQINNCNPIGTTQGNATRIAAGN